MSDNLFERLFELFQHPGPVNWRLAREIMGTVVKAEPIAPALAEEYRELGLAAQLRISGDDRLLTAVSGEIHPVDPTTWADENLQGYRFLIEPLGDKLSFGGDLGELGAAGPLGDMLKPLGPAMLGLQAGSMVGTMASEVLGQFDTGVPALDHDRLYLIAPNLESFAASAGLDPQQVRMWAALHEVAYHSAVGVPWTRQHFVVVVNDFFDTVSFDPTRLTDALTGIDDPTQLEGLVDEHGLSGLLGEHHDSGKLEAIRAFTAFLEGYGDYAVHLTAEELLPQLGEIERAYGERRGRPEASGQALQALVGLDLERHRAAEGASFCFEVARRWGDEALLGIWSDPERLPTLGELGDPVGWAARVLL